jgi:7,8-dihydropterin-6-yl-methyl-4-(beta-D-ribofuranosyl)aminobenzene 5'-phosphate synthase
MSKIRSIKVTTIVDNLVQMGHLLGQWGLSFLLEVEDVRGEGHKVISDTGSNKEAIIHNIKRLKLDLSDLECIFLSHGHGDHTAATVEIIKLANRDVKVVSHPNLFLQRLYINRTGRRRRGGVPKGEGIAEIEAAGGKIIQSAEPFEIIPGLWTTGQIPRATDFEAVENGSGGSRSMIVVEGELIADQILDDQALWMDVEDVGPMVITGCAHSGVVNTLTQVKKLGKFDMFHGLIGGTHLFWRSDSYLQRTIDELTKFNLELISPCHCTGFKAMTRFYQAFPENFVLNFSGRVIVAEHEPTPRVP